MLTEKERRSSVEIGVSRFTLLISRSKRAKIYMSTHFFCEKSRLMVFAMTLISEFSFMLQKPYNFTSYGFNVNDCSWQRMTFSQNIKEKVLDQQTDFSLENTMHRFWADQNWWIRPKILYQVLGFYTGLVKRIFEFRIEFVLLIPFKICQAIICRQNLLIKSTIFLLLLMIGREN